MTAEKIRVVRKGIYRIITVIQESNAGGYKLAQDNMKRAYDLERGKWYDSHGQIWEVVEIIKDDKKSN